MEPIGVNRHLAARFRELVASDADCFGQRYASSSAECRACVAPVRVDDRVLLVNEACRAAAHGRPLGTAGGDIVRLTSSDVAERLAAQRSVPEIFAEIVGSGDMSEPLARTARRFLYDRLYYLDREKGLPVPELPSLEELMSHVRDS